MLKEIMQSRNEFYLVIKSNKFVYHQYMYVQKRISSCSLIYLIGYSSCNPFIQRMFVLLLLIKRVYIVQIPCYNFQFNLHSTTNDNFPDVELSSTSSYILSTTASKTCQNEITKNCYYMNDCIDSLGIQQIYSMVFIYT